MGRISVVVVLGVVLAALPVGAQSPPDTPANRLAAAKRYLQAVPPAETVGETLDRVVEQVPEARRAEFRKALAKQVSLDRIAKITLDAVVKHFTVREIEALTAFYGSPEGKSINQKFGAYMADVMPAIQSELAGAIEEIQKEID
jgi:hypothetical protein